MICMATLPHQWVSTPALILPLWRSSQSYRENLMLSNPTTLSCRRVRSSSQKTTPRTAVSMSEMGLGCVKTPLVMRIGGLWRG